MGSFAAALARVRARGNAAVIAEIKRRTGDGVDLMRGRSPAAIARDYVEGGATCLSVVTGRWFGGTPELLAEVAAATSLPVLAKDFIRSADAVRAARDSGASAVLVTLKLLSPSAADAVLSACEAFGVDPFVEVSSEEELRVAIDRKIGIIAINNRDIGSREQVGEGIERSLRLRNLRNLRNLTNLVTRSDILWVSASGIDETAPASELARHGFDALLIGTSLLLAPDPKAATRRFVEACSIGRMVVKICGVQDEAELECLSTIGAHMVGLLCSPGEAHSLEPSRARDLAARCPDTLAPVLVTIERDAAAIARLIETVEPRAVQLAGFTQPSRVQALRRSLGPSPLEVIQVLHHRGTGFMERDMIQAYEDAGVDRFILDIVGEEGRLGSTGAAIPDEALDAFRAAPKTKPFLLAGGLDPDNVRARLARSGAGGVDVSSGVRSAGRIDLGRAEALIRNVMGTES